MTAPTVLLVALLALPLAVADAPVSQPTFRSTEGMVCPDEMVHAYVADGSGIVSLLPRPGCAAAHDIVAAVNGAFFPSDHHRGKVCVADAVVARVTFVVGADVDGDGVIAPRPGGDRLSQTHVSGPCAPLGFAAGADGGWWVILGPEAVEGTIHTEAR